MKEIAVVIPIGTMRPRDTWAVGALPLHVTVLPNVRIADEQLGTFTAGVEAIAAGTPPLVAVATERALFGPSHDIAVTTLERDPALGRLHENLLEAAREVEASALNPEYMSAGWRPHITHTREGAEVAPGETVQGRKLVAIDCTTVTRIAIQSTVLSGSQDVSSPPMLSLRPIQATDAEAIHEWASQPRASRYQAWGPNTFDETRSFVEAAVVDWRTEPQFRWTFVALAAERVVGIGEVHLHAADEAEISYGVHTDLWGSGIGTRLAHLLVDWIVEHLGVRRIVATCDPRNRGSERVLRKIGMSFVRTDARAVRLGDGWRDSLVFELDNAVPTVRRGQR